ncbi:MAG: sialate O-acetylesterase [Lachnospiraceae bacterium]|jgi:sialate O-acetylesterase|nr:sialate O-acetylesterase [Lachnospiraceae bacterium]
MASNYEIKLPYLISDGMVLQREKRVKIWGEAAPDSFITLTFCNQQFTAATDEHGKWEILFPKMQHGGPYDMVIECGMQKKIIHDVLIGEVWVLGGQSNMQLPVARTLDLFEEEVKNTDYPEIRKFSVPEVFDFHGPHEELSGGSWICANPQSIYEFSAVGFFFAKKLYDQYKIPIGLIHTAIGGTHAEAWISENSIRRFNRFREMLTLCKEDSYVNGIKEAEEKRNQKWYEDLNANDAGMLEEKDGWYREDYDASDWKEIDLPRSFRGTELEKSKGSVWFRKEIMIPERYAGAAGKLVLGTIVDGDETYLNGVPVGNTGYLYPPRRYEIPEGLIKPGKNVLTVRVIMTKNIGAFVTDMPYFIKVNGEKIPISGTWKYRVGTSMEALAPMTFFQYKPVGLYNGMIYPLRNYAIQGVLWYQGESNSGQPEDYYELFRTVISDWRSIFSCGEFPFLYVQLTNYCPWRMEPENSGWARIREEQRRALSIANTGMAVIHDVGEYNDLHPQDKKTVGERLALWARKLVHGEDLVCSGPIYDHMEVEEDKIRLHFTHTGSGFRIKGKELKTFTICGEDGKYQNAKAYIDGDTVIVFCEEIKNPVNVRYGWSDNPEEANLYNREGLPASTFTTEAL